MALSISKLSGQCIGSTSACSPRSGVNHTSDQRTYREQLEALGFDVPVTSGDHTSMFEGWWHRQCSAFTFVEDHRDRRRDYEIETLEQFDELTAHPRQVGREVEA